MTIQKNIQTSKKRAISLDLARGWMLLLIVLAHAPLFLYNAEPGIMSRPESISFIDTMINMFGELFIDNRARPLFAVLFGYGLMMVFEKQILRGNSQRSALKTIRRRCWYLILFGIIFAVVIGGQDILMAYGIAGLLTAWLLPRDNKTLIKATIIITLIMMLYLPLLWGVFLKEMNSYGFGVEFTPDVGYLQFFIEAALSFPIIPIFIHFLFPVLPPVLIGMWAGKKHLLVNSQLHHRKLKKIAVIGIMVSIIGAIPLLMIDKVWWPSFQTAGIIWGFHIITGMAAGIGYAALFGVIADHIKNPGWLTYSLTALGKRSLTFFIFNEALLVILLSPVFFDLGGTLDNIGVTIIAVFIWIIAVVLAAVLEKLGVNGPLESAMRYLVYQKYTEKPAKQKGAKY
ncbi:DUF418 domain-containing protein [Oceanobacillus neutriphilus]|uniref:DUF418 domain-containing protein n=1 Tax=Oceanobacillus neutriphilus TaxID=531815 RepID=A0ABQ2NVQ1_9BACI|nr:DUF418 domain-containing protein [Oceanobacillus neutriphilus]GGP11723.1 hypothetical protein GCM10011346_24860 [Oceanobacillus neutriphilus]